MSTETPNWKALFLYLKYWRRFPWLTLAAVGFSLILALNTTMVPLLVALVLNQVIQEHTINVGLLVFTGVFQLAIILAAHILDKYGVSVLHQKVEKLLYDDSFKYLANQDYSFFSNRFSGALVTQASRFAKVYTTFNDVMFFDLIPQLVGVLVAVGIMAHYNLPIALMIFVVWLAAIIVVINFGLRRLPLRRAAVAKESQQVGELADVVNNAITVKTFGAEDREIERYGEINRVRGKYFLRSWWRAVRNAWIVEVFCALLQMIVLVGGILAVFNGKLEIAVFLLFQVYALRIIDNIRRSVMIVRQMEVVAGDAQEMTELLEQPPLVQDKARPEKSVIKKGQVEFAGMTFRYDDGGTESLFEDFNLAVKAGQKVGLVGPSGGGKTTITRLVLRFMDVQGGAIKIDGQDIRDIKQQDLRRAIAYVPQEPLLFHRSIKDNIRYGKPSASDEEVIAAAKKSFAHDFIKTLPEGYDTLVGERGVKLSGGQRQRVAIARAMLKNAPILVLDEATSALDSESERVIQKALWELMKDKTALVIAHRLSTIQRMDRIVVLDEGRIIEEGTHASLLKQKGLYARLWKHQSGGFIEE